MLMCDHVACVRLSDSIEGTYLKRALSRGLEQASDHVATRSD